MIMHRSFIILRAYAVIDQRKYKGEKQRSAEDIKATLLQS